MAKKSYRVYCSVYGCLNSSLTHPEKTFFKLPKNPERQLEWLHQICRTDLENKSNLGNYRVCEKHFNLDDIRQSHNRKLLKKYAIPLLMLPSVPRTKGFRKQDQQTQTALSVGVDNCTQTENVQKDSFTQTSRVSLATRQGKN